MLFAIQEPEKTSVSAPLVRTKTECGIELANLFLGFEKQATSPHLASVWAEASLSLRRRFRDGVTCTGDRAAVLAVIPLLHELESPPFSKEQAEAAQRFIVEEFSNKNIH